MSLTAVLKEIASVSAFFASRDDTKDVGGLQKSFADSVLNKLKLVQNFGPSDGAQLHEALKQNQFGQSQTQRIKDSIDALVQKNASEAPVANNSNRVEGPKQLLKNWWNYFTQDQIDFLYANNSFTAKMTMMVERGMSVGCVRPKEDTYKWCLAMLLICHYKTVPAPRVVYDKLQDLKQSWVSEAKAFYLDHLQEFPETPEHLPKKIYEQAYPEAQPVCLTLQGVNTIADSIPLRSNSKLLKHSKSRSETAVLEEAYAGGHASKPPLPNPVKAEPFVPVKQEAVADDSDNDPDVILLKQEYEFKLAKLKATKRESRAGAMQPVKQEQSVGRLTISRTSTGCLYVEQSTNREPATTATLASTATPADATPDATADAQPPTIADLDPWTQAAVKALTARKQGKTATQSETTKPTTGKKDAAKHAGAKIPVKKKKVKTDKAVKDVKTEKNATKVKKEKTAKTPAKKGTPKKIKAECDDADEVPKSKIMAAMPKSLSSAHPVRYWGGIIYTAVKARKFRALKVRGDSYTEASAAWGSDKPSKEAWRKCVKAIEDHHSK